MFLLHTMTNPQYCWSCGEAIATGSEICDKCGEPQVEKSRFMAAFLNFSVPGAGYAYLREKKKGFIWAITFGALAYTSIGLILAIPMWIFGIFSAYKKAQYNFA